MRVFCNELSDFSLRLINRPVGGIVNCLNLIGGAPLNHLVIGRIFEADFGDWKAGDKSETDFEFEWTYLKLEIDNDVVVEADDFDVAIGGVSQTGDIRAALLI